MQNADTDNPEIHLPERWAVLEQALRQMDAEDAANRNWPEPARHLAEEPESGHPHHSYMR